MTPDFAIVTTVKRGFASRLPSDLVGLILEFANSNAERKIAWQDEFRLFINIMAKGLLSASPDSIGFFARELKNFPSGTHWPTMYWPAYNYQLRAPYPGAAIVIESDYTSCLHPSPYYLNGKSFIIEGMVEGFKNKLQNLQNRIPRPGALQREL